MCAVSDLPLGGDLVAGRGGGELTFAADAELLFCPNTRRKSNISRQQTLACMAIMLMSVIMNSYLRAEEFRLMLPPEHEDREIEGRYFGRRICGSRRDAWVENKFSDYNMNRNRFDCSSQWKANIKNEGIENYKKTRD